MYMYNNNNIGYFHSAHIHHVRCSRCSNISPALLCYPFGAHSIQRIPSWTVVNVSCKSTLSASGGLEPWTMWSKVQWLIIHNDTTTTHLSPLYYFTLSQGHNEYITGWGWIRNFIYITSVNSSSLSSSSSPFNLKKQKQKQYETQWQRHVFYHCIFHQNNIIGGV